MGNVARQNQALLGFAFPLPVFTGHPNSGSRGPSAVWGRRVAAGKVPRGQAARSPEPWRAGAALTSGPGHPRRVGAAGPRPRGPAPASPRADSGAGCAPCAGGALLLVHGACRRRGDPGPRARTYPMKLPEKVARKAE